jgi:hypothetical protein
VAVSDQPVQAIGQVAIEPVVDGVRVTGLEQTVANDGIGGVPGGDLEQGRTAFADVRPRVVIPVLSQLMLLLRGQG